MKAIGRMRSTKKAENNIRVTLTKPDDQLFMKEKNELCHVLYSI